jgi:hypothetical protein
MNLTPPFSFRSEMIIDGEAAFFFFGIGRSGKAQSRIVIVNRDDSEQVIEFQKMVYRVDSQRGEASLSNKSIGGAAFERKDTVTVQFDFNAEGQGTYTINGKQQDLPEGFSASELTGGFAIMASDDTAVLFKNTEVRPNAAFWPVSPAVDDE